MPWDVLGLALLLATGCDSDELLLSIDLRTDFVPGTEFDVVRTELLTGSGTSMTITESRNATVSAIFGDDFAAGRRVAEFALATPGAYTARTSLLMDDGRVVAGREVRLELRQSFGLVMLVTRTCRGIECPGPSDDVTATTCVGGLCVPPECSPLDPEACGTPECESDSGCTARVACADARCVDGFCLQVPSDERCGAREWCSVERGCLALPSDDAGVCMPAAETCNEADDDCDGSIDEDFDLATDVDHCGRCGMRCDASHAAASCEVGRCALACDGGFADCNTNPSDGCEADLSSAETCGSCSMRCAAPTPLCVSDGTSFRCVSDCPSESPDLCGASCTNTDTSLSHCGGCDRPCDPASATGACSGGTCRIASCDTNRDDCNSSIADGCEADLMSPATCGGCGTSCPASAPYCVASGATFACTSGCVDGRRGGDETDIDCGGTLCAECTLGRSCRIDTDCAGTAICTGGVCVACGECEPAATETIACGRCGMQTRTCNGACSWGAFGACSGEGACMPGAVEMQPCGRCGMQTRTCSASCGWSAWGACSGEGECMPGASESRACGMCGTQSRMCGSTCGWGAYSGCAGEGVCAPGTTTTAGCPGPCMAQTCTASCAWSGSCTGCSSTCAASYTECGTSCTMPGYHADSLSCSTSCTTGSCIAAPDNQARCERNCGSTFTSCGSSCPSGYHAATLTCSTSCTSGSCISAPPNMVRCDIDSGSSFSACGSSCPTGYHVASRTCSTACTTGSCISAPANSVRCDVDSGGSFTACGSTCPTGYSVTSRICSTACTTGSCIGAPDNAVVCTLI